MKGNVNVYYDEEADFLEISIGKYKEGYFQDIGEGISKRIDSKTGRTVGIAIMSFLKRTRNFKDLKISLPLKMEIC